MHLVEVKDVDESARQSDLTDRTVVREQSPESLAEEIQSPTSPVESPTSPTEEKYSPESPAEEIQQSPTSPVISPSSPIDDAYSPELPPDHTPRSSGDERIASPRTEGDETQPPPDDDWVTALGNAGRPDGNESDEELAPPQQQSKPAKKTKSTAARGEGALAKSRGTGFEDNYADPPMTPEEFARERKLYDATRPFHERIEECIQRYQSRRRLAHGRDDLFRKYLSLGGIDTTQRQFTGTARADFGDYDKDDIRGMAATSALGRGEGNMNRFYDPDHAEHWDVDFPGVVAGYLSDYLPDYAAGDFSIIRKGIDTVLNFLNYVHYHDVCPEYAHQIEEARAICQTAEVELAHCRQVKELMPGGFNLAARIVVCGEALLGDSTTDNYSHLKNVDIYKENQGYAAKFTDQHDTYITAPKGFDAERIFKANIAVHCHNRPIIIRDMGEAMRKRHLRVIHFQTEDYEIIEITPASADQRAALKGVRSATGELKSVQSTGYIRLRPCTIEDGWDNHWKIHDGPYPNAHIEQYLVLEDSILALLKLGMKMRLTINHLNVQGIAFIKECVSVLPSFYTYLPQQLMLDGWKAPVLSTRPGPSIHDPDAEEAADALEVDGGSTS